MNEYPASQRIRGERLTRVSPPETRGARQRRWLATWLGACVGWTAGVATTTAVWVVLT
jgi:hypothetical protein